MELRQAAGADVDAVEAESLGDPAVGQAAKVREERPVQEGGDEDGLRAEGAGVSGRYQLLYADPPWKFRVRSDKGKGRSAEAHYDCMDVAAIKALPIGDMAEKDAVLLMWATDPFLEQAFGVLRAWGFAYKTVGFYWAKLARPVWEQEDVAKLNRRRGRDGFLPVEEQWRHNGHVWHMGTGYHTRCLDGDARVFVADPVTKRVEYLKLKDLHGRRRTTMIHTHRGWRQIFEVVRNEAVETYRVETSFGDVVCSENHKWAAKLPNPHRVEWRELFALLRRRRGDPNNGFNLCFSTTPMEIAASLPAYEGFDLTDDVAWLIGLFVAEGNYGGSTGNQVRFSLNKSETHIAERIKSIVEELAVPGDRYAGAVGVSSFESADKGSMAVYFNSSRIKRLIEGFVSGRGAHGKRLVLDRLWQTSAAFRRAFVRGILDGDGTKLFMDVPGYEGFQELYLCNQALIEDVRDLLVSIGVQTRRRGPYVGAASNGTLSTRYGLYFASPRCKGVALDGVPIVPAEIKRVTPAGPRTTYDISVSDQAFVVEGLISHNSNPEPCLLATRGKGLKRAAADVRKLIVAPRRLHSQKPDEARERLERLYGDVSRLELFSRSSRPGWAAWGLETGKLDDGKRPERRWRSDMREMRDLS